MIPTNSDTVTYKIIEYNGSSGGGGAIHVACGPRMMANVMSCLTVRVINTKSLNLTSAERNLGICTAPQNSPTKRKPQILTCDVRFLDYDR